MLQITQGNVSYVSSSGFHEKITQLFGVISLQQAWFAWPVKDTQSGMTVVIAAVSVAPVVAVGATYDPHMLPIQ